MDLANGRLPEILEDSSGWAKTEHCHSRETMNWRETLSVAVVDDSLADFTLLREKLIRGSDQRFSLQHFVSIDQLLSAEDCFPDAIILDRCMPDTVLTETRIREVRGRFENCGVILHTGLITPSLRSTAAHEGAFAVVEKDTLDGEGFCALLQAAAIVGPQLFQ